MTTLQRADVTAASLDGRLFIHPTDTIYGIGCDATDEALVRRLRDLKGQWERPLSVIAPSTEWIGQACRVTPAAASWLARLPGPYTLILPLKEGHGLPDAVTLGSGSLGVRLPDAWFAGVVAELGRPVVTTSANRSGEEHATSIERLDPAIREGVDLLIDDGPLDGRPSTLVRLDQDRVAVRRR